MKIWSSLVLTILLASVGTAQIALASIFPDVPDGHAFQKSVEMLVGAQVINGNPDGRFYPDKEVNRAEILKMLYKAKGKSPDPTNVRCFPDVAAGSWYEPYVCDATANRYVAGYSDGTFQPNRSVNRAEALKMITTVFGIDVEEISESDREIIKFVDVSTAAWYTKYLFTAFSKGILPIPGQDGSRFYPDKALLRGEAAAYIFNALGVGLQQDREESQQESSQSSSTSTDTVSAGSSSIATDTSVDVQFPFAKDGKFTEKRAYVFRFDLTTPETVSVVSSLQSGQQGGLSCRLYRIVEGGYVDQYYLGYEESRSCYMTVALPAGSYQLQLQPTTANATFSVSTKVGKGDGNDGFSQALLLPFNQVRTESIGGDDFQNWYKFAVTNETKMMVELTNSTNLRCIVYAMKDVDLYGFSGPECNQSYTYPPGTYYVAVGRGASKGSKQTYTIRLK